MSTTAMRTAPAPSMNSLAGKLFFFIALHGPHHSALKSSRTRAWSTAATSEAAAREAWKLGCALVEAGSAAPMQKLKTQSSKLKRNPKHQAPTARRCFDHRPEGAEYSS